MNKQHQEVQVWLEKLFGDEHVPAYELTDYTVGALHDLMIRTTQRESDSRHLTEDLRQKAEEYRSENARLENLLQMMHLSSASLSQSGVMSLRTLANLALTLQIKDASDTSYLLALHQLKTDLSRLEENREEEKRKLNIIIEKTKTADLKRSHLKRALAELEQQMIKDRPEIEKTARETGFTRDKAKEYQPVIKKLQVHLDKLGMDPTLTHQALLERAQDLQKLKAEIEPMKQKLDSYHGLPPDTIQAHIQLEQMREKVANLEKELAKKIDVMTI